MFTGCLPSLRPGHLLSASVVDQPLSAKKNRRTALSVHRSPKRRDWRRRLRENVSRRLGRNEKNREKRLVANVEKKNPRLFDYEKRKRKKC